MGSPREIMRASKPCMWSLCICIYVYAFGQGDQLPQHAMLLVWVAAALARIFNGCVIEKSLSRRRIWYAWADSCFLIGGFCFGPQRWIPVTWQQPVECSNSTEAKMRPPKIATTTKGNNTQVSSKKKQQQQQQQESPRAFVLSSASPRGRSKISSPFVSSNPARKNLRFFLVIGRETSPASICVS